MATGTGGTDTAVRAARASVYSDSALKLFWRYGESTPPGATFELFRNGLSVSEIRGTSAFEPEGAFVEMYGLPVAVAPELQALFGDSAAVAGGPGGLYVAADLESATEVTDGPPAAVAMGFDMRTGARVGYRPLGDAAPRATLALSMRDDGSSVSTPNHPLCRPPSELSMNSKLRFGIITLMALLLAVVLVLIGVSLGATFSGRIEFLSDSASGWIASISTVVIALLTIVLALETQSMRKLQQEQIDGLRSDSIRPDVDLYLGSSSAAVNLADLVLRNNGSGTARDVRVVLKHVEGRGSAEHAAGVIDKLRKPSFISSGVSTLGPRRELTSFVVSFFEMSSDEDDGHFDVCVEATVACFDVDGKEHTTTSIIDLAEFKGVAIVGGRPAHDAVSELKKMRETLGHLSTGFRKLSVNTFSAHDRKEERAEIKRRLAAARNEAEQGDESGI